MKNPKACPFCSGEVVLITHPLLKRQFRVGCVNDCFTMPSRPDVWFTSEVVAVESINKRNKLKHESVQSWEKRNGNTWPQDAPVWYRTYKSCRWRFALRYEAQHVRKHDRGRKTEVLEFVELIADDSGTPPADWSEK